MRPRGFLWLLVPLACAACASAGVAPTPSPVVAPKVIAPKPSEPPAVARWAELQHDLARQLRAAGTQCASLARTMTSFVSANRAELESTSKALVAWEQATADHVVQGFYDKVFPALDVRIDAGIRCKNDKPTVEAFDRFFAAAGLDRR